MGASPKIGYQYDKVTKVCKDKKSELGEMPIIFIQHEKQKQKEVIYLKVSEGTLHRCLGEIIQFDDRVITGRKDEAVRMEVAVRDRL